MVLVLTRRLMPGSSLRSVGRRVRPVTRLPLPTEDSSPDRRRNQGGRSGESPAAARQAAAACAEDVPGEERGTPERGPDTPAAVPTGTAAGRGFSPPRDS